YTLVRAEVDSGMTVFVLDASFMPMPLNVRITAFLAGLIPQNCSIEGEVGEIGGTDNSTIADALEFVTGVRYAENVERDPVTNAIVFSGLVVENGKPVVERKDKGLLSYGVKIDRIALNNGTAHGNNYDKDGNLIQTKMNLIMTAAITKALAPYGIEIVQHGTTGTPLENLPALRAAGITEAHVGTNWQNIAWEVLTEEAKSSPEAAAVVDSMIDMLVSNYGEKYNVTDRATADPKDLEKLIGKELKLSLGAYKARLAALPDDIKAKINIATKENETIGASAHFKAFDSAGTASLVRKFAAIGKPPVLMGGRSLMTIAQELEWVGGEEQMIYLTDDQHRRFHLLQEEFIALNKIGALADDLEGILENSKNPESGLNPEDVDSGIAKVLNAVSSNRLNRVQGKQDVIVLPASEVSMLDGEQFFGLKDFLDLARSKDKVVVIVAANEPGKDTTFDITGKERLDDISRRFSKATTYKLESLAWLKDLKDLNLDQLRPLSELYAKHGLALECTLEKLQNKSLADAIARGI
ncbi:MAG: class II fructose-bisphosphate aldolase, partial [Candidatus Omnitrophica bacterium]|nr:class II fructose-bisphosphate aldolase [Candidatus Omnitrophota bacterium]